MNIICIIPARSGSKGIKNKNIQKIKNQTLIERAYLFAKKTKIFKHILVSTDEIRYLKALKKYNYKFNKLLRPKILSKDNTTDLEVIKYELKRYEKIFKEKFDYIALLQPTSPLRNFNDFKKMNKILYQKKPDALWTISKIDKKFNPIKQVIIRKKFIKYYDKKGKNFKSRQQLENTYIRNGVAYFFSRKTIFKFKKILPVKSMFYIIKSKFFNIDSIEDLKLAKKYLN